jgi:hypothetical protein
MRMPSLQPNTANKHPGPNVNQVQCRTPGVLTTVVQLNNHASHLHSMPEHSTFVPVTATVTTPTPAAVQFMPVQQNTGICHTLFLFLLLLMAAGHPPLT